MKDVPCLKCASCGEFMFTDEVSAKLERLVESDKGFIQELSVIDFAKTTLNGLTLLRIVFRIQVREAHSLKCFHVCEAEAVVECGDCGDAQKVKQLTIIHLSLGERKLLS